MGLEIFSLRKLELSKAKIEGKKSFLQTFLLFKFFSLSYFFNFIKHRHMHENHLVQKVSMSRQEIITNNLIKKMESCG
jgi:hypothetical protein